VSCKDPKATPERQARVSYAPAIAARPMDTTPRPADSEPETDADRAAGRIVDADQVGAWIESIGTDHELPSPSTRRR
jgi:predicted transcriptional regulator